jgi:PAS domain S-box-containing protein
VKWVREKAELEFDGEGNLLGGFGITQDISDIKAAEQALRDSEERFQLAAEIGHLGTWDWNVITHEVFWSRGHYEILGYREGEITPGYEAWVTRVHPDDRPRIEAEIQRSMREHVDYTVEFRVIWPNGGIHWMSARGRYAYDEEGACQRMLGIMADITTLKQAELALREADQRKDEFLAMLAHELRNPLAPIRNAAFVLGRLDLDEPRVSWAWEIIENQVNHLTHLVDELLDVSRIARGKVNLQMAQIHLEDLIRQSCESVQPLFSAKGHHLAVTLKNPGAKLEGDLVRLVQVLQNLLNNAAKYTPDGGRIELIAQHLGSKLQLQVRDNGMGIPADLLPHVFDLFQQGARTLDRSQGGLGIGLTLVRRLVELHGGKVVAESAGPGQGAVFTVLLPVSDAAIEEALPDRKSVV